MVKIFTITQPDRTLWAEIFGLRGKPERGSFAG
jgi:hypothetical protein